MWKRPACHTQSKASNISSATARVAPDLLNDLAILSDTTVRRSAANQKDLKPYWKSEERPHSMPHPDVLVTLFPYIFHVKTKQNKVYEYLKTKNLFKRHKYLSPNALNIKHF